MIRFEDEYFVLAGFSELLSQVEIASICGAIKIEIEIVFRLLECHVLVKEAKCARIKAVSYRTTDLRDSKASISYLFTKSQIIQEPLTVRSNLNLFCDAGFVIDKPFLSFHYHFGKLFLS